MERRGCECDLTKRLVAKVAARAENRIEKKYPTDSRYFFDFFSLVVFLWEEIFVIALSIFVFCFVFVFGSSCKWCEIVK